MRGVRPFFSDKYDITQHPNYKYQMCIRDREYRARNLEKQREYDRIKAREYRARRKAQAAAAQPTQ